MLSRLRQLFRRQPAVIFVPAGLSRELDPHERAEIRAWFASATTQKVLALMEARHPVTTISHTNVASTDPKEAVASQFLLNRIKGWESYRNQLLSLAVSPRKSGDPVETYPSQ